MISRLLRVFSPANLLAHFAMLSLVTILLIGLFLSQAMRAILENQALQTVVTQSRALVELSLLDELSIQEMREGISADRIRAAQSALRLDFAIRGFVEVMTVDRDLNVVFSLDNRLIGSTVDQQLDAWTAAQGGESSALVLDVSQDNSASPSIRRIGKVVNVHLPVQVGEFFEGENVAVLTVSPYAPIAERMSEVTRSLYWALALSLLVLYGVLLRVMARAVAEITRLQSSMVHDQRIKAMGSVTGGVAHDFNNLLAVIDGNLELLDKRNRDAGSQEYLDRSRRAVELGANLTHQLLAFAREQSLKPENLSLNSLLAEVLPLLQTSVGESIVVHTTADVGLWNAFVDKAQLEVALMNLVINARHAMSNGGELCLGLSNEQLKEGQLGFPEAVVAGDYVRIAVVDTGNGMDRNTLERCVDPYVTTKDVGEGVGLGLPMVFGFVKQSGGYLKIESTPGTGTRVEIYLPRADQSLETVRVATSGTVEKSPFHNLHVLLVEDDDTLRETFTTLLQQLGCVVRSASDGQSAMLLQDSVTDVDLILCDVVLPNDMRGPEVASKLLLR